MSDGVINLAFVVLVGCVVVGQVCDWAKARRDRSDAAADQADHDRAYLREVRRPRD